MNQQSKQHVARVVRRHRSWRPATSVVTLPVVVLMLALVFVLAACGGESATPTATTAPVAPAATDATATTAATPTTAPTATTLPTATPMAPAVTATTSPPTATSAPPPTATTAPPTATTAPQPTAPPEPPPAPADVEIAIRDFAFEQAMVTIPVGTTVIWTNYDEFDHSATDDDGRFDTGLFGINESRSVTFDTPGTYEYFCLLHPNMRATIVVQ